MLETVITAWASPSATATTHQQEESASIRSRFSATLDEARRMAYSPMRTTTTTPSTAPHLVLMPRRHLIDQRALGAALSQ
jgi:hypothetical protein